MSKQWQAYAHHVVDSIEKIARIQSRGDLANDEVLYDATLRNLQTMAEATQRPPEHLKAQYPHIYWNEISGFRNILVHNYLGDIDPITVSRVVHHHLPPLLESVKKMLQLDSE
jgi:uncharacterized protein with HEPN domain